MCLVKPSALNMRCGAGIYRLDLFDVQKIHNRTTSLQLIVFWNVTLLSLVDKYPAEKHRVLHLIRQSVSWQL